MAKFHFLFEQSGTFKNAAIKLGHTAYDYDIVKTDDVDFQLDIFEQIDLYLNGAENFDRSIFAKFDKQDIVFAFFPCTYFSTMSFLPLRMSWRNYQNLSEPEKIGNIITRSQLRQEYYEKFLQLFELAYLCGFKLVVENPWTASFLKQNAPFPPQVVHQDRTKYGDVLKKPTSYWFVNEEPNFLDMPYHYKDTKGHIVDLAKGITRSLIDCDYALNFISHYFGEVENG